MSSIKKFSVILSTNDFDLIKVESPHSFNELESVKDKYFNGKSMFYNDSIIENDNDFLKLVNYIYEHNLDELQINIKSKKSFEVEKEIITTLLSSEINDSFEELKDWRNRKRIILLGEKFINHGFSLLEYQRVRKIKEKKTLRQEKQNQRKSEIEAEAKKKIEATKVKDNFGSRLKKHRETMKKHLCN